MKLKSPTENKIHYYEMCIQLSYINLFYPYLQISSWHGSRRGNCHWTWASSLVASIAPFPAHGKEVEQSPVMQKIIVLDRGHQQAYGEEEIFLAEGIWLNILPT